ncbi:MAG: hypothetical protein AAF961_12815 [Planctomycetota bacterium]
MLLPRFSLRTSLLLLTGAGFLFFVLGPAAQGRAWALGIATAIAVTIFALLAHAAMFGISYCFSQLLGVEEVVARTSRGGVLRDQATSNPTDE